MPKLKTLSGEEVIRIFQKFGFSIENQRGSHVKLRRFKNEVKQTLTTVVHKELDKGTLNGIYKQALDYISEDELRGYFYSE